MLQALTAIFACQLAGEAVSVALGVTLPGPVIGMVLLFVVLCVHGRVPRTVARVGDTLLAHLSLLFVPAGVGILQHMDRLRAEALPIGGVLIISTLATIVVTALVMNRLKPNADTDATTTGEEA